MNRLMKVVATILLLGAVVGANAATVQLKIATAAPEASSWVKAMRSSAEEIEERTEGRVIIKYYPGGIQGTDKQVLRKMRIGSLHGGAFTPSALSSVYPDINLYSLPLVFNSVEEANYVRERMDQRLIDGLSDEGYVTFGFAMTGFAMVMSNDPVHGADDLKGKKVWVPEDDEVSFKAMQALSVSPTPMPLTDVLVGLQTELLDIVSVSPIGALLLQWYTRVEYVSDLPIVYTFGFMAVDARAFGKIDAADQAIVREVMSATYAEFDVRNVKDNDDALQAILDKGLERVTIDDGEADRIRATIAKSNRQLADQGVVTAEMYDAMLQYRDEYRNGQSGEAKVAATD